MPSSETTKYFVSQGAPWTMDNLPDVAVGQNYQLCWPDQLQTQQ